MLTVFFAALAIITLVGWIRSHLTVWCLVCSMARQGVEMELNDTEVGAKMAREKPWAFVRSMFFF